MDPDGMKNAWTTNVLISSAIARAITIRTGNSTQNDRFRPPRPRRAAWSGMDEDGPVVSAAGAGLAVSPPGVVAVSSSLVMSSAIAAQWVRLAGHATWRRARGAP